MTLAVVFFSIAGIPPLAGFLSKWFILLSGIYGGYYLFSLVIVISSVIAGVYYVRVVKLLYFQTDYPLLVWQRVLNRESGVDFPRSILIGVTLFFILFFIICPNFLLQITHDATICLY
jgi:NADH:ubiquinone oxidoreductase subunit 2 (subunit N)